MSRKIGILPGSVTNIPYFGPMRKTEYSNAFIEALRWSLHIVSIRKSQINQNNGVLNPISNERKNIEFLQNLNSILFIKRIDDIIIDYLIKQFLQSYNQTNLHKIRPVDSKFRQLFKRDHKKLILQLREKLLKNQGFVRSAYTKLFRKMINISENPEQMIDKDKALNDLNKITKNIDHKDKINKYKLSPQGTRLDKLELDPVMIPAFKKRSLNIPRLNLNLPSILETRLNTERMKVTERV